MYIGAFATAGQTMMNLQPLSSRGTKGPAACLAVRRSTDPDIPTVPSSALRIRR